MYNLNTVNIVQPHNVSFAYCRLDQAQSRAVVGSTHAVPWFIKGKKWYSEILLKNFKIEILRANRSILSAITWLGPIIGVASRQDNCLLESESNQNLSRNKWRESWSRNWRGITFGVTITVQCSNLEKSLISKNCQFCRNQWKRHIRFGMCRQG